MNSLLTIKGAPVSPCSHWILDVLRFRRMPYRHFHCQRDVIDGFPQALVRTVAMLCFQN